MATPMKLDTLCAFENFCFYSWPDGGPMGGPSPASPIKLKIEFNDGTSQIVSVAIPEGQEDNIARVTLLTSGPGTAIIK
jgi:hypothetical protein